MMSSSIDLTQKCDLCKAKIPVGTKYGMLNFHIETLSQTAEYPLGIVDVHRAETVNTMCMSCTSKYNSESVKALMD